MTLAVVAVIAALAWAAPRGGGAQTELRNVRQLLVTARLRALSGEPQAVVYEAERRRFLRRGGVEGSEPCASGAVRAAHRLRRGVRVEAALRDDVVWLPDGTGRSCSGGGVYGGRITLADDAAAWSLVVSSMGRMREERLR